MERVGEFRAHLADAHRAAASERSDTREDLESLLNLQQRLDYNAFFPEPRWVGRVEREGQEVGQARQTWGGLG